MPDLFVPNQPSTETPSAQLPKSSGNTQSFATLMSEPLHPLGSFSNYLVHPEGIVFDDQEPDETILLFLRRDKITNVPWILTSILLLVFPFLLTQAVQMSGDPFGFFYQFRISLILFYVLGVFTYAFTNFVNWFYNISLVTNERVIDLNFYNVISKGVSATKIDLITDVSFSQSGSVQTVFDYGNVLIQTAAAIDKFELERLPRPHDVVQIIESLIGEGGDKDAS